MECSDDPERLAVGQPRSRGSAESVEVAVTSISSIPFAIIIDFDKKLCSLGLSGVILNLFYSSQDHLTYIPFRWEGGDCKGSEVGCIDTENSYKSKKSL